MKVVFQNFIFFFLLLFVSCNKVVESKENCDRVYKKVTSLVSEYYIENDTNKLNEALKVINTTNSKCKDESKFILLNINIYNILGDYKNAYSFLDTISGDIFGLPYKKMMYLNFYKASMTSDSAERIQYWKQIVNEIETYLKQDSTNKEAIFDLFTFKIKYLNQNQVLNEIDELAKKSDDIDFFEGLKNSMKAGMVNKDHMNNVDNNDSVLP